MLDIREFENDLNKLNNNRLNDYVKYLIKINNANPEDELLTRKYIQKSIQGYKDRKNPIKQTKKKYDNIKYNISMRKEEKRVKQLMESKFSDYLPNGYFHSPEFIEIRDTVLRQILIDNGMTHFSGGDCNWVEPLQKKILKEKYNIDWLTTRELYTELDPNHEDPIIDMF